MIPPVVRDPGQTAPQSGCRVTASSQLRGAGGRTLLRTVQTYDFDGARRLVRYAQQTFTDASKESSEPTIITYAYAASGALATQVVVADRGQFPEAYERTRTYDEKEFVVRDEVDIGRDGSIDLSMRYTNTYEADELRERSVDVRDERAGMPKSERERETWTPEEGRAIWTHVSRTSTDAVRSVERYGIVDGEVGWREVDMGGDGTVDFRDEPSRGASDNRIERDAYGRPIVIESSSFGETETIDYDDACGGIALPSVNVEAKFRTPGTAPH